MTFWQIRATLADHRHEQAQHMVLLMNCMTVAMYGNEKQRRETANILLGRTVSKAKIDWLLEMPFLATPIPESPEANKDLEWARRELEKNPLVINGK